MSAAIAATCSRGRSAHWPVKRVRGRMCVPVGWRLVYAPGSGLNFVRPHTAPHVGQDVVATEWVSYATLLDHVDIAPEQLAELIAHVDPQLQGRRGPFFEDKENVDVAVGAEVGAQDRAQEGELPHPPLAAE